MYIIGLTKCNCDNCSMVYYPFEINAEFESVVYDIQKILMLSTNLNFYICYKNFFHFKMEFKVRPAIFFDISKTEAAPRYDAFLNEKAIEYFIKYFELENKKDHFLKKIERNYKEYCKLHFITEII